MIDITQPGNSRGILIRVLGVVLVLAGLAPFVAVVFELVPLREANLLVASGGAIALGLILVAAGLAIRLQEAREARMLDAEFRLARRELDEALALSERLTQRFRQAGIQRPADENN